MARPTRTYRSHDDRGAATSATLLAISIGLFALVVLANFITYQYGRGAVRSALDQAARSGSRASSSAGACQARADDTIRALLGGPLGDDITITCTDDGQHLTVSATGTFHGWLPIVPDYTFTDTAIAAKEPNP
jgi:hypothetical protein